MKQPIQYAIILFLITGICVGILGGVNQVTAPIIAANEKKNEMAGMQALLTECSTFLPVNNVSDKLVKAVYLGQSEGETKGYIVKVTPTGYGGIINLLVAIDSQGEVKGINILSLSETPGYGANATKNEFKDQFKEKLPPFVVSKQAQSPNEIQVITGATITSTAITEGVNQAIVYVMDHQKEWGE